NTSYYGGGMKVAPQADPADGMLDVVCVGKVGKGRFLANLPKVFKGEHIDELHVTSHRAREVRVESSRPFDVYADGDALTGMPVELSLRRGALRLIAPA